MSGPQIDLHAAAPGVTEVGNGERSVRFVGMQHIAQRSYYDAAARIIRGAQLEGHVHFYEWVDVERLDDVGQRKIRTLTQVIPTPEVYGQAAAQLGAQLGLDLVAQRLEYTVGLVDDRDVNADISPEEYLRRIEAALGPITLRAEDLETPLDEPVSAAFPEDAWAPVVLDSRNATLAELVVAAPHERIVISYGQAHVPGWLAEMRRRDPRWAVRPA